MKREFLRVFVFEDLRKYKDVVIKQADKGSVVVVMDRTRYVVDATRQLIDLGVYVALGNDPTEDVKKMKNRVRMAHGDGSISDSTQEYLLINSTSKAGRFYLLQKLHKKGCPGRPVISGSLTEKISQFVDCHLKTLVFCIPSFVHDMNDFLDKHKSIDTLPEGAILVSIDMVYSPIPHDEGLYACTYVNMR